MKEHANQGEEQNPLFLYVSYNAAHSPLQVFYNSLLCAKEAKNKNTILVTSQRRRTKANVLESRTFGAASSVGWSSVLIGF